MFPPHNKEEKTSIRPKKTGIVDCFAPTIVYLYPFVPLWLTLSGYAKWLAARVDNGRNE